MRQATMTDIFPVPNLHFTSSSLPPFADGHQWSSLRTHFFFPSHTHRSTQCNISYIVPFKNKWGSNFLRERERERGKRRNLPITGHLVTGPHPFIQQIKPVLPHHLNRTGVDWGHTNRRSWSTRVNLIKLKMNRKLIWRQRQPLNKIFNWITLAYNAMNRDAISIRSCNCNVRAKKKFHLKSSS